MRDLSRTRDRHRPRQRAATRTAAGLVVTVVAVLCALASNARAATIRLTAGRDNTLFDDPLGSISNGAGGYSFVGTSGNGVVRRAVIGFDLGAVPAGSTVTAATLTMFMSQTISGTVPVTVHRLLAEWGEGTSDSGGTATSGGGNGAPATPGDATWIYRSFPGSTWIAAGGDFAATTTAAADVAGPAAYVWTGAGLASDVQGWLNGPASNHGWILLGDETTTASAKRFNTRENLDSSTRPQLTLEVTPPLARLVPLRRWALLLLAGALVTAAVRASSGKVGSLPPAMRGLAAPIDRRA